MLQRGSRLVTETGKATNTISYKLFEKMEENVEGSFLRRGDWLNLLARN
jgi:hypothetical protein